MVSRAYRAGIWGLLGLTVVLAGACGGPKARPALPPPEYEAPAGPVSSVPPAPPEAPPPPVVK